LLYTRSYRAEQPSARCRSIRLIRGVVTMTGNKHFILFAVVASFLSQSLLAQSIELTPVVSKTASRTISLPAEIEPFLNVDVRARVSGYVERVLVDRGSVVKEGQLLIELNAPEMKAQIAEAESKVQAAEADLLQAQAQLAAAQSTFDRMKKASE